MICRAHSALFSALLLAQRNRKKEQEKRIICPKLLSLITQPIYIYNRYQYYCYFVFGSLFTIKKQQHQKQQTTCVTMAKDKKETVRNRDGCSQVLGSMPCFRVVTFSLPLDSCVIWYHETDRDGKYIFTYLANTILRWGLLSSQTHLFFMAFDMSLICLALKKKKTPLQSLLWFIKISLFTMTASCLGWCLLPTHS